jgi:hypothetical protein
MPDIWIALAAVFAWIALALIFRWGERGKNWRGEDV